MATTSTFPAWLTGQRDRGDEIAEFAQQVAQLTDFPDSGGKAIYDGYFETALAPDELLELVRAAGLQAGEWRGVSVVADLLESTSGADPDALRRLELELAGVSPYRDVATGLHVIATRGAEQS